MEKYCVDLSCCGLVKTTQKPEYTRFQKVLKLFEIFLPKKNFVQSFTEEEISFFVENYKGKTFYATRLDEYLRNSKKQPRTHCCAFGYILQRKVGGYETFCVLLDRRGAHYNTIYKLLTPQEKYKNKNTKCTIQCESHNEIMEYSLAALQQFTSCPCPQCRVDPNHKNRSVERVKQVNGRPGQKNRHRKRVVEKYDNKFFLTGSNYELHHHHLDGQDFYAETSLCWEQNGLSFCATVHRDYHNNFLKNYSLIAKEYEKESFSPGLSYDGVQTDPDSFLEGVEVSRYTFCEYLRFLMFDFQKNNVMYVQTLNAKIEKEYGIFVTREKKRKVLTTFNGLQ